MFHVSVGMYRECFGAADPFDTVTFSRSWRLACIEKLFCGYQFIPCLSKRDTVTAILANNQRFPAAVDSVVIPERDTA